MAESTSPQCAVDVREHVLSILNGYQPALVIANACKLELFDKVDEQAQKGACTASGLATEHQWVVGTTGRLLNALVALELMKRGEDADGGQTTYSLTPSGVSLMKNTKDGIHAFAAGIPCMFDGYDDMANTLKTGKKTFGSGDHTHDHGDHQKHGEDHHHGEHAQDHHHGDRKDHGDRHHGDHHHGDRDHDHHHGDHHKHGDHKHGDHKHGDRTHGDRHPEDPTQDKPPQEGGAPTAEDGDDYMKYLATCPPEDLLEMYEWDHGVLRPYYELVFRNEDLRDCASAVDLGGGTGELAFALTRTHPRINVTVFEAPPVAKILKEKFLPGNEDLGVKIIEGDFFKDPLPKTDMYILANVLHGMAEDKCSKLLTIVYDSLAKGGRLLIVEKCLNDNGVGPLSGHMLDLQHCGGHVRTAIEFKKFIGSFGFSQLRVVRTPDQCSVDFIFATK